VSFTERKR